MSITKIAADSYRLGRKRALYKLAEGLITDWPTQSEEMAEIASKLSPADSNLISKLRAGLSDFVTPGFNDLSSKGWRLITANPLATAGGALGLAGGAYGAKKLYDYLTEEEQMAPGAQTKQEQMLALAKQYGPQAAAALAATGALYGGYRAMRSSDRD